MPKEFQYDVFLEPDQADKPRVRRLAERLPLQLGTRNSEFQGSACRRRRWNRTGWVWSAVLLGRSNLPFRNPANAGRRFIPLLLATALCLKEPVAICDLESA